MLSYIPPDLGIAPTNISNSSPVFTLKSLLQDQSSPAFLAAVANAVKQALSAEQAASLSVFNSLPSMSVASISGGVPGQPTRLSQLDSKALSLAASGARFSPFPPVTATPQRP